MSLLFVIALAPLGLKVNGWQSRLDKATLDLDLGPSARLGLLQKALADPVLQEDVRSAFGILQAKGFDRGAPEAVELLWPRGTTARADLDALIAMRTQLPEALGELQCPSGQPPPARGAAPAQPQPGPAELLGSIAALATDPAKQRELRDEAKNLFRSTPTGLETPGYKVVRTLDGPLSLGSPEVIELRVYEEFTVARTRMGGGMASGLGAGAGFSSSGAAGFNTLAAYLFGQNEPRTTMAMTMPVEISGGGSMAFVLPRRYSDAPPAPLAGSDVTIDAVPARLVAVKAFGGIVTDAEVARQTAALLGALAADGSVAPVDPSQLSVLQYNSPLTVPWRRRNEVAIVVTEVVRAANGEEESGASAGGGAGKAAAGEAGVSSWYDAGVRLQ